MRLIKPTRSRVTQGWAAEFYSYAGQSYPGGYYKATLGWTGHNGIDYAGDGDRTVMAAGDGVVTFAGWGSGHWLIGSGGGNAVMIDHGSHWTAYLHLAAITVRNGQTVKAGQTIGEIGATGSAIGPHLHFELIPKNPRMGNGFIGRVDPGKYMTAAIQVAAIEEDDMPYSDWPQKDKAEMIKDFWQYTHPDKKISGGKDAYWWQLNPGHNVWRTRLKSGSGKMYQAAAFLINNNNNGWKIPGLERLLKTMAGVLKQLAGSAATTKDLDAAVAQIDDNTEQLLADAVIDVDVNINGTEVAK